VIDVKKKSSVTLTRTIRAPRREVFSAWTKAEMMTRWGVDEFTGESRSGGRYRQVTRDDTGEHVISGEYREFVPDERLVMTWNYDGVAGRTSSLVTVELAERTPNATELKVIEDPVAPDDVPAAEAAWTVALADLEALLVHGGKRSQDV
jgi:uncharacterized protein YndB with AHSA1/START domain